MDQEPIAAAAQSEGRGRAEARIRPLARAEIGRAERFQARGAGGVGPGPVRAVLLGADPDRAGGVGGVGGGLGEHRDGQVFARTSRARRVDDSHTAGHL